jgi:hypothetical protein
VLSLCGVNFPDGSCRAFEGGVRGVSAAMEDHEMELFVQSHSESIQFVERVGLMHKAETVTQQAAAWHLDRVDQRSSILDGVYTYSQNGSGEWCIEC